MGQRRSGSVVDMVVAVVVAVVAIAKARLLYTTSASS